VTITSCRGFYDVKGKSVTFTTTKFFNNGDCAPPTWTAGWNYGDGQLTWTAVSVADFSFIFAPRPWQQID